VRPRGDDGTAIVEFVFLAVVIMVPLVYLVAAVATVQCSSLAVAQAARDAGRAFATGDSAADARRRVVVAVRLAFAAQGLPDDGVLRFVRAGGRCTGAAITPRLLPGAEFTVCVTRRVQLPGVPTVLTGRGIRVVGAYLVHVDDYRAAPPR
jgi:Flp pilus assembly protein TadG